MQSDNLRYVFDARDVSAQRLASLFEAAGLAHREAEKIHCAYRNSDVVCFCWHEQRLIGTGRALTDFEYHATIYDIAVHPQYQHRGIGSRLMQEILQRLPVWRVLLVADEEVRPFYVRLGFEHHGDVLARLDRRQLAGVSSQR